MPFRLQRRRIRLSFQTKREVFDTVEKEGNTSAPTIYNTVGKNRREKAL